MPSSSSSSSLSPSLTSILLLKTECDYSHLPTLWLQLEETTSIPRSDWEVLLSPKRVKDAPLKCDILLLPAGIQENTENDDVDSNDYSHHNDDDNDVAVDHHLPAEHGMMVFPGKVLLPCGNENVLSLNHPKVVAEDRDSYTDGFFHLSLFDCRLQLLTEEEEKKKKKKSIIEIPLSTSLTQPNQRDTATAMTWMSSNKDPKNNRRIMGGGMPLAESTRFLVLDMHLDNDTIESFAMERGRSKIIRDGEEKSRVRSSRINFFSTTTGREQENHLPPSPFQTDQAPTLLQAPSPRHDHNHVQNKPSPTPNHFPNPPPPSIVAAENDFFSPSLSSFPKPSMEQQQQQPIPQRQDYHLPPPSTQQQVQLLEARLQEELHSIQILTNLMVILPSLALLVIGAWVIWNHFNGKPFLVDSKKSPQKPGPKQAEPSYSSPLDCNIKQENGSGSANAISSIHPSAGTQPALTKVMSVASSAQPTATATNAPVATAVSRSEGKEEVNLTTKPQAEEVVTGQHNMQPNPDVLSNSEVIPNDTETNNETTSTSHKEEKLISSSGDSAPLSPCSLLKLQWKIKKQLKQQQQQQQQQKEDRPLLTDPNCLDAHSPAPVVSPESSPLPLQPKLKRSYPVMSDLHQLEKEPPNHNNKRAEKPKRLTPDNPGVHPTSQRLRTNTFVDDYW